MMSGYNPGTGVAEVVSHHVGLLEEQPVLLTAELSLYPKFKPGLLAQATPGKG